MFAFLLRMNKGRGSALQFPGWGLRPALVIAAAALASCARPGSRAPIEAETFDPGRLEKRVLATGFDRPMEIEVLNDGRIIIIELAGLVKIFHPEDGRVTEAASLDVFTEMENGLLGLALDPNFENNRWLYLFYSPTGPEPKQHVSRFTLIGDQLDLDSEKVVFVIPTQRDQCCHQAGSMEFGPAGNLFISTGDNTNPFESDGYSPSDYRKDRSPWDAAKSSGNTNDLRGKILRIHPEPDGTYSIPEGNLFETDDPLARSEVYVMGCRNPFRISVDQATGYLYWGEVGPDARSDVERGPKGYDEINQARRAGNFGWPYFVGDNKPYARHDFETASSGDLFDVAAPENLSPNNTGARILPPANPAFIWYPYVPSEEFPLVDEGGRTACAGPVFHFDAGMKSETRLPERFDGRLFIYEWERGWIKTVGLDAESNFVDMEHFMPGDKFLRPVDMQFTSSGDLYVLEYGETWDANKDSKLVRIEYNRGNRAPVARSVAKNTVGAAPLEVAFDSSESSDIDGDDDMFRAWSFTSADKIDSYEANPTFVYEEPGVYEAVLRIVDRAGASSASRIEVKVGNEPPEVTIRKPAEGAFFDWDEQIEYDIFVEDEEDGDTEVVDQMGAAVFLNAEYYPNMPRRDEAGRVTRAADPPGLALMKGSNCFNCHHATNKVVGPAFADIAKRYADDAPARLEILAQRVIQGATGNWGEEPMLPHEDHTIAQVKQMVEWVLRFGEDHGSKQTYAGAEGSIPATEKPENDSRGVYVLTASYTDDGATGAARLSDSAQIMLRNRRVQAEHFSSQRGIRTRGIEDEGGGRAVAYIANDDFIAFEGIDLSDVGRLVFRVAAESIGGKIEVRLDSAEGEVLGAAKIEPTGDWETWRDVSLAIDPTAETRDVYFRFVNPEAEGGGLMNVNWIEFQRRE